MDGQEKSLAGRSDGLSPRNILKIENLKNNDVVKVDVAIALASNGNLIDGQARRETDFITITTPFSKY